MGAMGARHGVAKKPMKPATVNRPAKKNSGTAGKAIPALLLLGLVAARCLGGAVDYLPILTSVTSKISVESAGMSGLGLWLA